MSVRNLTRKFLPALSKLSAENKLFINAMPEMRLAQMLRNGDKNIVQVGMNQCKAARILPGKIHTIYTDGLAGCNSVGVVAKGLDGNPVAILSHYTPLQTSRQLQMSVIDKQLQTYDYYLDKTFSPKIFYNIPGYPDEKQVLQPCVNPLVESIKSVFNKWFKSGYDEHIALYQCRNRPAFFSSANIFQFDPKNVNNLKITTVGEKEHFINLAKNV
ncbi:MAG: hypothetical protein LBJ74_01460 [Heliobacteriaceae bacterium]|jgi:hypothetical protein|nr:hypothetical protein [Heliobacteriaceae bacterium]